MSVGLQNPEDLPDVPGVYAFTWSGTPFVKVGSSTKSMRERVRVQGVGLPFRIRAIGYIETAADEARGIESSIHRRLERYLVPGTREIFTGDHLNVWWGGDKFTRIDGCGPMPPHARCGAVEVFEALSELDASRSSEVIRWIGEYDPGEAGVLHGLHYKTAPNVVAMGVCDERGHAVESAVAIGRAYRLGVREGILGVRRAWQTLSGADCEDAMSRLANIWSRAKDRQECRSSGMVGPERDTCHGDQYTSTLEVCSA